ncbi:hypothetical protein BDP55DRAFT_715343 [Colletotrichum godetiae]|uniref:Uncharacterized protein n=1 Tax=Colletotrichum godetiae TaxID=1209918 RepID=A0AAJ0ANF3_9PEZI|nr:uncharacterized protein BDP55DRAFT_715343 [Colletotrichum godetiae]KAK1675643.1 hypothetical protein BDP55DRAFT_715343 [Colletotrichum godetiae]
MDYRAEIDFITQAEWTAVVAALHRDILDNREMLSADIRNVDSGAGIAYSVLKAVYPKHSDKQLRFAAPEVLANSGKLRGFRRSRDNATRATVATKYLKERSRLWMVAPITRTVDDKTAKTLVEDRCTQQPKYDEAYSNIMFVCSRADDVSLDEAAPSFGIVNSMEKE